MDDRVTEFVDHLHEHFVDPCVIRRGRYIAPTAPGYSSEIKAESRAAYQYPDGPVWKGTHTRTIASTGETGETRGIYLKRIHSRFSRFSCLIARRLVPYCGCR